MASKGYMAALIIIVIGLGGLGTYLYLNSTDDSSSGVIKIGATTSQTGKYQTEGQRVLDGYKMAVSDINSAGGVKVGDKSYDLELITYDDQSDATKAGELYDKLIATDDVDILLGPYSSGIVKAVAPKAELEQIPFIQAGGASDSIYTQGYEYTFGLYRKASLYSAPFFQWLNDTNKNGELSSAAIFLEDSSFPNSVEPAAEVYLDNAGIALKNGGEPYKYTSGELTAIGTDMNLLKSDGGADLIMMIGHYADAAECASQIAALGLTPKAIFGTVGPAEEKFATELGADAENVFGFAQWVPNIPEASAPGITDFINDYKSAHSDETPAYHAAGGYAAVQVVKAAIEEAGTFTDGAKVRAALTTLSVDTIWGHVEFGSTGLITGSGFMTQVQSGAVETVYPMSYKTAEIVFPNP